MKKSLEVSNMVAFIVTILVNYVLNTGILNGKTIETISDQYKNYFTPAGYAFIIWGLIYIGLFAFIIFTSKGLFNETPIYDIIIQKIGWLFVISCILNCVWVFTWLIDFTGFSVIVMFLLLLTLLKILAVLKLQTKPKSMSEKLCIYLPFAIYAGWISVAFLTNISAYYTKMNWDISLLTDTYFALLLIAIAGLLHIIMVWKQKNYPFAFVGIWALIAIAVSNWNLNQTIVYASLITCVFILSSILIHLFFFKKNNTLSELPLK